MGFPALSRKRFLQLCGGAVALGVTGCDSGGDDSGSGTDGTSSTSTTSQTTDPTDTTNPSGPVTDPSSPTTETSPTTDPTTDGTSSTTDDSATGDTGETSTGDSTGSGSSGSGSSGSGSSSTTGPSLCPDGAEATDVSGHPHTLSIPADQLQPGTALNGLTMGGDHQHTIDLTADNVDSLLAGEPITVVNADAKETHSHDVTISCI